MNAGKRGGEADPGPRSRQPVRAQVAHRSRPRRRPGGEPERELERGQRHLQVRRHDVAHHVRAGAADIVRTPHEHVVVDVRRGRDVHRGWTRMQVGIGEGGHVDWTRGLDERGHVARSDHVDPVALGQRRERAHEAAHDRVGPGDKRLAETADRPEPRLVGGELTGVGRVEQRERADRAARLARAQPGAGRSVRLREQAAGERAAGADAQRREPDVLVEHDHVRPAVGEVPKHVAPQHALDLGPE